MTPKEYATTSGIVFLLVALAHLMRVIAGWDFRVAGWDVPSWVSVIAVALAGYLSYTGFRIATRSTQTGCGPTDHLPENLPDNPIPSPSPRTVVIGNPVKMQS